MPIKNLSEIRRLPRLGKISLGIKKTAANGKEYPSETDFFVCPPEVQKVFGEKPKELKIMFPVESTEVFFQQWLKCYGASLLKCKGDGIRAFTWDEEVGGLKEIPCPCPRLENKECRQTGILQFLIPDVPGAGVWQITTSSRASIIDINSSLDFIRAVAGRVRMIPLILKREKVEMQRIEDGKPKKSTHYTLKIDIAADLSLRQLQESARIAPECVLLPPPDETKDGLLYPDNGFKPEEEDEPEVEEQEECEGVEEGQGEEGNPLDEAHHGQPEMTDAEQKKHAANVAAIKAMLEKKAIDYRDFKQYLLELQTKNKDYLFVGEMFGNLSLEAGDPKHVASILENIDKMVDRYIANRKRKGGTR